MRISEYFQRKGKRGNGNSGFLTVVGIIVLVVAIVFVISLGNNQGWWSINLGKSDGRTFDSGGQATTGIQNAPPIQQQSNLASCANNPGTLTNGETLAIAGWNADKKSTSVTLTGTTVFTDPTTGSVLASNDTIPGNTYTVLTSATGYMKARSDVATPCTVKAPQVMTYLEQYDSAPAVCAPTARS